MSEQKAFDAREIADKYPFDERTDARTRFIMELEAAYAAGQAAAPAFPPHLRDDTPFTQCSKCGRKSWSVSEAGTTCSMLQPNNSRCDGEMIAPAAGQLSEAINNLERDPHMWSARPCETCRELSTALGYKFGCERKRALLRSSPASSEAVTSKEESK